MAYHGSPPLTVTLPQARALRRPEGREPSAPLRVDPLLPNNGRSTDMDFIRIIIAILLPPLGVFLQEGLGKHFWINILLTILGYIPGIVHAVYIIASRGRRTV